MKRFLFISYLVVSFAAQIYVTYDVYAKLATTQQRLIETYEFIGHYSDRFEFIESTVNSHDESINALREIKK